MTTTTNATLNGNEILEMFFVGIDQVAEANVVEVAEPQEPEPEPLLCEFSGEIIEGEPFAVDGHVFADEDNARRAGWTQCERCGEWCREGEGDSWSIQGDVYCSTDCVHEDGWESCERCGEWVHVDDAIVTGDGEHVFCDVYCANRSGWYTCDHCGEWTHEYDLCRVYSGGSSEEWCEDCTYESSHQCEGCDERFDDDDMVSDDYGDWYCERCSRRGLIHQYGYRPSRLNFLGGDAWALKVPLFLGVELETDSGYDQEDYAYALSQIEGFEKHFWMTYDSSLDNGVELTGHPMTLAHHEEILPMYEEIKRVAGCYEYVSHNSGNCGLHVHVNRNFFGRSEICQDAGGYKLMRLLQRFEKIFFIFSRRTSNQWCSYKTSRDYKPKEKVSILKLDEPREYNGSVKHMDALQLAHLMKQDETGHSQALNFQHSQTFEFRIFRGTMKWSTYFAALALVDGMCRTVKEHGSTWVETVSWYELIEAVIDHCSCDYSRDCLVAYLNEKGLR